MIIPDSLVTWKSKMEQGGNDEKQILSNIESEKCSQDNLENKFFSILYTKGIPSSPEEALSFLKKTVWENNDIFSCTGTEVPNMNFLSLLRFEKTTNLKNILPDTAWKSITTLFSLSSNQPIESLSGNQRKLLSKYFSDNEISANLGIVKKGKGKKISKTVWATDLKNDGIQNQIDNYKIISKNLLGRLGIEKLNNLCLVIIYERNDLKRTLHVPRVFDAIDLPKFRPVSDCSAPSGKSLPVDGNIKEGLPEAVHRYSVVKLKVLEIGEIS